MATKKEKIKKTCKACATIYEVHPYREQTSKYCSYNCYYASKKGQAPWNKNKKGWLPSENHGLWKGKKASLSAKHKWTEWHFGKPNMCEHCGTTKGPKNKKHWFQWANISGKYIRSRADWKRLCYLCHRKFDINLLARGERHGMAKLTEVQVQTIRVALLIGVSRESLSKKFNVTPQTILNIGRRDTWKKQQMTNIDTRKLYK